MFQLDFSKPQHVHFIGIGGISMSGLAELLLSRGFNVSGSDGSASGLTAHLEKLGARISIGQSASNIEDGTDAVVYTAAIHPDNPEYAECVRRGLPLISRATLLGQVMKLYELPIAVAGTHGKTTTTSMISEILLNCDTDPTLSVGGILSSIGGNFRVGGDKFFVAEACEYTNSYLEFFPKVSVILNVEEDHLDFFKDLADIRRSFRAFAELLPADGTLIINNDIENVNELTDGLKCRVISFGHDAAADYHAEDIGYEASGHPHYSLCHGNEKYKVDLGVVGEHNIYNSLAAIAVSDLFGLDREKTLDALKRFTGTGRRFEIKGRIGDISIIDDYAHHPSEIAATLKAMEKYPHEKLWCVFQPHTYTRTKAFLHEFADALKTADTVLLADIYAARETDDLGVSSKNIADLINASGGNALYFSYFDDIENYLLRNAGAGDVILTMGAGDVYKIGDHLLGK
ncbi:MAG: UDP-N-acetylmuramate--L-alanine ligase [Lachnospiraceae bacterium]|nr:UDP-N-acetylmuramate--L-alanine ligase [Lachnospiraceae bacterium]